MAVEQQQQQEEIEEIRTCPKCGSKLWNSAVTGLFRLFCSDCKHIEIKDWVFTNPKAA
jgi:endogenous inhibitor of DNA gyrase (YacG/DUF329 family)